MASQVADDRILAALMKDAGLVVKGRPNFDLDSYIHNYTGRTRLDRLSFIGKHSVTLCIEALKGAIAEAKQCKDVEAYRVVQETLALAAPHEPEATLDQSWVDRTNRENAAQSKKLEEQLKGYKNNLIKESIRLGNDDLGVHYQAIGELEKAYEAFNRMKADMTMARHVVDTSRRIISLAILQERWPVVMSSIQKINSQTIDPAEGKELQAYLRFVSGLALLSENRFEDAARSFLSMNPGFSSKYNDTGSPNDVAVYGGLLALASMDREDLQTRVLENTNFRTYLELEPHIRRAVQQFVQGRYSACLATLEHYRNDYLLDIHLHNHVTRIYELIRKKSIIQYFVPFSCVTLDTMVDTFGGPDQNVEEELITMIKAGTLQARIDAHNRLLVAVPVQPRQDLQREALASAEAFEREILQRMQRMNILGAGLELKNTKKNAQMISMGLEQYEGSSQRARGHDAAHDSGYE